MIRLNLNSLSLIIHRNHCSYLNRTLAFNKINLPNDKTPLSCSAKHYYSTQLKDEVSALTSEQKTVILNAKLDEIKLRNMCLFESKPQNSIFINFIGLVGAVLISYMSYVSYHIFSTIKIRQEDTLFTKFLNKLGTENFRLILCSVVGLIGIGVFVASVVLTSRQVKRLYLLKGGQSLGIITEGVFGRNKSFTVNLDDASFLRRRDSGTAFLPFKVKQHYFYYLIQHTHGEIIEKILFDYIVCLQRF